MTGEAQGIPNTTEPTGQVSGPSQGQQPAGDRRADQSAGPSILPPPGWAARFEEAAHGPVARNPVAVARRHRELMRKIERRHTDPDASPCREPEPSSADESVGGPEDPGVGSTAQRGITTSGTRRTAAQVRRQIDEHLLSAGRGSDRTTRTRQSVSECAATLTDLWTAELRAAGDVSLLDFSYLPGNLAPSAKFWSQGQSPENVAQCVGQRRVGMSEVRAIDTVMESYRRLDQRFGGGLVRMGTVRYLHDTISPLLRATYSARVGRHLFDSVADCTQLVGWMAYDVGAHGLAQRYFAHALRLTRATGNHSLGAYILSRMSRQATYLGHAKIAVDLAVTGRERAGRQATPAALALLWSVEARGHGLLGDAKECAAALANAERHLGAVKREDEPEWSVFFDEAQLCDEFAHCYRDLHRSRDAVTFAKRSLRLRSSLYARSKAFCHTVMASSYLEIGELEEACKIAGQLAKTITALHSSRGRDYLRALRHSLSPYHNTRAVRDFDALLHNLNRKSGRTWAAGHAHGAI